MITNMSPSLWRAKPQDACSLHHATDKRMYVGARLPTFTVCCAKAQPYMGDIPALRVIGCDRQKV